MLKTARFGTSLSSHIRNLISYNHGIFMNFISCVEDIREQGRTHGCAFVRVRPQLELSDGSLKLMSELGLKRAPMYLSVEFAGILDLNKPEEEILAGASQGFRRKLRKAEKNEIEITADADIESIKAFCELAICGVFGIVSHKAI